MTDEQALAAALVAAGTTRRLFPRTRPYGVGANALQALVVISLEPAIEPADMAERLALSKAGVSGALAELVARELVAQTTDGDDKRRHRYAVTATGHHALRDFAAHARRVLDDR